LKTGDKGPRVIADIIRLGRALSIIIPESDAEYLRRLNNARERHVGEQTALLNFPEFMSVFKNIKDITERTLITPRNEPPMTL
jgi:hypothetical protein